MPSEDLNVNTNVPVLSWANHELSSDEYKMAKNTANLPFVYKHLALMPDVHLGRGALVGSVIATEEAIIPAAVGVDLGCGMAAIKTPYNSSHLEGKLRKIRRDIEAAVPVGFNSNEEIKKDAQNWNGWSQLNDLHPGVTYEAAQTRAMKQMGTLGGGK